MTADLTTFADALKEYYTPQRVESLIYKDAPLLALLPKQEKFPGNKLPIPVRYGISQGVSATFATAQSLSTSTSLLIERFELQRVKKYGICVIDGETIKATNSDDGAFLKALTAEIDSVMLATKRRLAWDAYRKGWGKVGVISSISGATFTLTLTEDVVGFEKGMQLLFGATEESGTLRSSTALTVSGVNRSTGVITCSATVTTITGVTTGDYVFVNGDRTNTASPTRLCMAGLGAWVPQTAPTTGDSFLTVDRTSDPTRLAGQRVDGRGIPIEESLIEGAVVTGREGGALTHYFMSYGVWSKLEKALGSRVRYSEAVPGGSAKIGFKAIVVTGPGGEIKCVADAYCPSDTVYGLDINSWKLYTMGPMIDVAGEDGLDILRQSSSDGYESRHAFYGNLGCDAPGHNVTIQVA